ncbi:hypothetical protein [Streptomyces sp. NPDC090025]|uniref:hypothetical protein n=1 Tax=Streptomyces sp. NPDC090025 TaxID=3365922 RepID=UPI003837119F
MTQHHPTRPTHHDHPTRPTRTTARRTLRRETTATLGLLADTEDFTAMRRYATFPFTSHTDYLHHVENHLKTLRATGGHTSVTLFDPEDYADHCAATGRDPDHPTSRAHYTADQATTGPHVPYTGQPLATLLATLVEVTVRHTTWEYATLLLAEAGECPDCGRHIGHAAFARASLLLLRLLDAAGPGTHHLVCSVPADEDQLVAALRTDPHSTGPDLLDTPHGGEFVTVLAAGIALGGPGGVVLRTTTPGHPDRLHGWRLAEGQLHPLTEAEVFDAYCTDAHTGDPIAPEPHVHHLAGLPLDPLPDTDPRHHPH